MVSSAIKLKNSTLLIQPIKGEWSSVFLKNTDKTINLGAEDRLIFLNRLLKLFAQGLDDIVGKIENLDVCWVCSFSENHHTIYAGTNDDNLYLFFQSPNREIIANVVLNREEAEQVLDRINTIISAR